MGTWKERALGNTFILRHFQREWYNEGLLIVPLGTGITLDWAQESTEGTLWDVEGEDATLISKDDFRKLVRDVVHGKSNYEERVPINITIELLAAFYWPRVRLLQWWKDDDTDLNKNVLVDNRWENWLVWMSYWLRDEHLSCKDDNSLIPGKGDIVGNIHCLFEMKGDNHFTVIPDAYGWPSIVEVSEAKLPVADLYKEDVLEILKNATSSHRPVHVKCGRETCCDYMYFYVLKRGRGKVEFVCTLVDSSKHNTAKDQGRGGNSQGVTSSDDQKGIYDAA